MIIKIVCAGANSFEKLYKPDPEEMLIGVDGGIYNIINLGLMVDVGLGDFDSCNIEDVLMHCKKTKVFPKEKDYGDLELAVREIIEIDFKRIIIYNATGGRLDHFMAIVNVLIKYAEYDIEILDEVNRIRIITTNTIIPKSSYKYCSLFAIESNTIISLKGFKYNLNNYSLTLQDNLCLSNEIKTKGQIEVNNKKILVIETL